MLQLCTPAGKRKQDKQCKWDWTPAKFSSNVIFVANAPKGGTQTNSAKNNLPFEEALKKLEGIVEVMESDELPLETLLAKYEEGTRLVKICQDKLAEAELRIQQLEKTSAGEFKLKPFEKEVES